MKLMFDQNLSPRFVSRLADLFPGSSHVSLVGLEAANDIEVWNYARDNEFILVSKDADFSEMSMLRGFPPKVIWLRIGNCTTTQIETLLRNHFEAIEQLEAEASIGILTLA
jgi:predicted nuclease of predicted toxin-antitoxin system